MSPLVTGRHLFLPLTATLGWDSRLQRGLMLTYVPMSSCVLSRMRRIPLQLLSNTDFLHLGYGGRNVPQP